MKLQQSISKRAKQQWVGRELVLLAEGESEETPLLWEARTEFTHPRSTAKFTSTISARSKPSNPAAFTRRQSLKPTTTT